MGEKIFAAIIRSDEAETFGIIEPLDGTECHILATFPQKNEPNSGATGLPV